MPGGSHEPSGGAEPASYPDFCTVESASSKDSVEGVYPRNKQVLSSTRGRCLVMSAASWIPQLPDKCPGSPGHCPGFPPCIASFCRWFLKCFFSHSALKRQNQRLRNLGTELNNREIMNKKWLSV